jgi:nucleotide-binding universal stress UspA family protein
MATLFLPRILVAVDGSKASDAAIDYALTLGNGGELIFAYAIDRAKVIATRVTPYGGDTNIALDALEEVVQEILGDATLARSAPASHPQRRVSTEIHPMGSSASQRNERSQRL